MNSSLKLILGFILVMMLSTTCYSVKFPPIQVRMMHRDMVSDMYKKCIAGGNDSATCQCVSQMISNGLNDTALENCDFRSKAEFISCTLSWIGKAKGMYTPETIALCKKNPAAANQESVTTTSSSGSSTSIIRILILLVSVIALLWLIKSTFLNKS